MVHTDRWPSIATAITAEEAELLEETCRGRTVLELGSETGFSTCVIGRVAKSVVCVDWHRGYPTDLGMGLGEQWTLPYWQQAVETLLPGYIGRRIIPMVGRFQDVLPMLRERFEVVFLDGGHDEEQVLCCLGQAERLGLQLILHDYGHPACSEKKVLDGLKWQPREVVGTMAVGDWWIDA